MNQEALTQWLLDWSQGDERARDALAQEVYQQIRAMASRHMGNERAGHTLQPTALANEAFIKLFSGKDIAWRDRLHFFAVASRVMRQVLTDAARAKQAGKRDGGQLCTLHTGLLGGAESPVDALAFETALSKLEQLNATHAQVVELRYFAGLTVPETAEVLDVSVASVNRYWRAARAFLHTQLADAHDEST